MVWRSKKDGTHYNTDKKVRDVSDDDVIIENNVIVDEDALEEFAREKAEDEIEADEELETNTMTMREFLSSGNYLEDEVRRRADKAGSHFFDDDTMRFFSTRVSELMWQDGDRKNYESNPIYFITSEQDRGHIKHAGSVRAFTVRSVDENGHFDTIGDFQGYSTLNDARKAIKELLEN